MNSVKIFFVFLFFSVALQQITEPLQKQSQTKSNSTQQRGGLLKQKKGQTNTAQSNKENETKKPKKRKLFFKKMFKAIGKFVKKLFKPRKEIYVPKRTWSVNQLNDKGDYRYEFSSLDNFNSPDSISNEEFNPAIHKSSRDYFQLIYPYQSITGGTLPEVKNFLYKWFKIKKDQEKLDIEHYQLDEINARNRNQKGQPEQFPDLTKVQMYGSLEDASYNTDFDYTIKQDCKAIKSFLANPQSIECKEIIDKDRYIVKGVYEVKADFVLGSKVQSIKKMFHVVAKQQREAIKPIPAPAQTKKVLFKGHFLRDIVEKKLEMSEHMYKWWAQPLVKVYYRLKVRKTLAKNERQIRQFYANVNSRLKYVERDYQVALKDELLGANTSPILDKRNFQMTVDRMTSKVDEINAYYIKKAIQKQTYDGKVKHDMDVYYASLQKYQYEQKEIEEMFNEENEAYKKDRELDDNFRKWTSKVGNF